MTEFDQPPSDLPTPCPPPDAVPPRGIPEVTIGSELPPEADNAPGNDYTEEAVDTTCIGAEEEISEPTGPTAEAIAPYAGRVALPAASDDPRRPINVPIPADSTTDESASSADSHANETAQAAPDDTAAEPTDIDPVTRAQTTVDLPEDIDRLLDKGKHVAPMPQGNTAKYMLDGHPELLVRHNTGYSVEETEAAVEAGGQLRNFGVNVLPGEVRERGEHVYVITKTVEGVTLDEALTEPTPELIQKVDANWKGLAEGLVDCLEHDRPFPGDITTTEQYMVGTIAGDDTSRIRMTDLPHDTHHPAVRDTFSSELLEITGAVVNIENRAGTTLPGARDAINRALPLCQDSIAYGDALIRAIQLSLAENVEIYPPGGDYDDLLERLRTR
jgi:hypothetical protein